MKININNGKNVYNFNNNSYELYKPLLLYL